jgi:DNA segregation ATPase FtsK/SpoIIIE, S-DNA-T family
LANRRRERPRPEGQRAAAKGAAVGRAPHEVIAVLLGCVGLLSILALASFDPHDASLNTSGRVQVQNWIGPLGAYWADVLLQALGVSAYALAAGCMLAGWRALTARRIVPGLRESMGLGLTVVSVGALAHLVCYADVRPYPAGGVIGAILGTLLRDQLAVIGSYIAATALVLVSFALTADGVLAGLGLRGIGAMSDLLSRIYSAYLLVNEKRRRLAERRRELAAESARATAEVMEQAAGEPSRWSFEGPDTGEQESARERRKKRVQDARERALAAADREAEEEDAAARARALRELPEPSAHLDDHVDLSDEEDFTMGVLPSMAPTLAHDDAVEVLADDVEIDVPVRAAVPPPPPLAAVLESKAAEVVADEPTPLTEEPKRLRGKNKNAEPQIVDVRPEVDVAAIEAALVVGPEEHKQKKSYELPSTQLLDYEVVVRAPVDPAKLRDNASRLVKTLKDYGIEGHVREIRPGPVVTMYEYVPAPGIKLSKIASLADDLAMSMEALRVRIVAPIPGKGAVGIEIPNETRETVFLKEIIASDSFKKQRSNLTMALGKDIEGNAYATDLVKMPHLLVAGATGAGKSVSINTMIMSILFRSTPDEVRMIMVDPKMLELSVYDGIPHLLLPVVTDPKKAALALRWAVEEMERRYTILSETGVRGIDSYNKKLEAAAERGEKVMLSAKKDGDVPVECKPLPYIVVIVDELADLMMVASRDVEASIMRLAQMARAAGIHLILATQRPSVDVITGVIKANFPTRIAFQVASKHDSRTIIDANGAEHLLGRGDMLYLSPGAGGISRVHGAYVSDEEIQRTVSFLKTQGEPEYDESILAPRADLEGEGGDEAAGDKDEMYDQAVAIVAETRQASISMIQRRLRIGYNRAARMVELMETEGIVGPADGAKPREVLVSNAGAMA